jgi:hypothetical protein
MAETLEERLDEEGDEEHEEDDVRAVAPAAEADEEPGCTVEGGLARL